MHFSSKCNYSHGSRCCCTVQLLKLIALYINVVFFHFIFYIDTYLQAAGKVIKIEMNESDNVF